MQFPGRTEFGLSVMAVERHTRYTPKWETYKKKIKTYKNAITAALVSPLPPVPANRTAGDRARAALLSLFGLTLRKKK